MMQRGQDNGRNYCKENMENAVYYNESIFIYRMAVSRGCMLPVEAVPAAVSHHIVYGGCCVWFIQPEMTRKFIWFVFVPRIRVTCGE